MVIIPLYECNIRNAFKPILITMKTGITIQMIQTYSAISSSKAMTMTVCCVLCIHPLLVIFFLLLFVVTNFSSTLKLNSFSHFLYIKNKAFFVNDLKRNHTHTTHFKIDSLRCLRTMIVQHNK